MKCNAKNVTMALFMVALLVLAGCGGGGSATNPGTNSFITNVGWLFDNAAPDSTNNGPTCLLNVALYYNSSISAADIDSFSVTSPNGWQWMIASSNSQLGTSSSGAPYIGARIYYGNNPNALPLSGSWTFQLKLKDGRTSSLQKILHEPGSSADATHQYLYTEEDWTPSSNATKYVTALRRFPQQGYTLQYSAANGGTITSTGLPSVMTNFLAAEPRAYNLVCWLYDANKTYLGYTTAEFSTLDHSRTGLVDTSGELLIVPASTISSTGQVDLAAVKYLRFICLDGAQYAPSSYSNADYRSISALIPVVDMPLVQPYTFERMAGPTIWTYLKHTITVDSLERVYVTSGSTIYRVDANGPTMYLSGAAIAAAIGGGATASSLDILSIDVGPDDKLYLLDDNNRKILVCDGPDSVRVHRDISGIFGFPRLIGVLDADNILLINLYDGLWTVKNSGNSLLYDQTLVLGGTNCGTESFSVNYDGGFAYLPGCNGSPMVGGMADGSGVGILLSNGIDVGLSGWWNFSGTGRRPGGGYIVNIGGARLAHVSPAGSYELVHTQPELDALAQSAEANSYAFYYSPVAEGPSGNIYIISQTTLYVAKKSP